MFIKMFSLEHTTAFLANVFRTQHLSPKKPKIPAISHQDPSLRRQHPLDYGAQGNYRRADSIAGPLTASKAPDFGAQCKYGQAGGHFTPGPVESIYQTMPRNYRGIIDPRTPRAPGRTACRLVIRRKANYNSEQRSEVCVHV